MKRHMTILVCMIATLFLTQLKAQETEPNNSIATANTIALNGSITGDLATDPLTDLDDYFEVITDDNGNLTATADLALGLSVRLRIFSSAGSQLAIGAIGVGPGQATVAVNCLSQTNIYIQVEHIAGAGTYTLSNTLEVPLFANDVEPNNSTTTANTLVTDGVTFTGHLGHSADTQDWYQLVLPDDGRISVSGSIEPSVNASLAFFFKNGSFTGTSSAVTTGEISLERSCNAKDTLLLRVLISGSGCGSYSLTFDNDAPPPNNQDIEPNNGVATANTELEDGETVEGRMGYAGLGISDTQDWYKLILPDDGRITVSGTIDSTMNASLAFFFKNGSFTGIASAVTTGEISLERSCNAKDTLLLRVLISGSGCGSYSFTFDNDAPPPNNQDIEPNNGVATVNTELEDGETVEGRMGYAGLGISDTQDWYKLILPDDGTITVSGIIDSTMNATLAFFFKQGSFTGIASAVTTGEISLERSCNAKDTLLLRVLLSGAGCGSYSLTFDHDAPLYSNDVEPNNSAATGTSMANADKVEGHLNYTGLGISDSGDYYEFTVVEAPFELDAKITMDPSLTGRIAFYNSSGGFLAQTSNQTGSFSYTNTITTAGTYYLNVIPSLGCGSYQLGDLCGQYPTVTASPVGPVDKCPGDAVALSASAGLATYEWLFDGAPVATTQVYAPSTPGNYQVVGYDINGCPDTSAVVIVADLNCDDGDPCTDDSCVSGTCINTFSGDDDSDGTCNNLDLCPLDPNKIAPETCGCGNPEPGTLCDDDDITTMDDLITAECVCLGTPIPCPGDVNGDFIVDITDFIIFNSAFDSSCSGCPEDLNEDGIVEIGDFLILNSNYGSNCLAFITNNEVVRGVNSQLQSDMDQQALGDINADLAKHIEELGSSIEIDIVPNPNEGRRFKVWLNTVDSEEHLVNVEILDLTGKRVHVEDAYLKKGDTSFFIEPYSALETGMYLIHFTIGTTSYSERMSVQ